MPDDVDLDDNEDNGSRFHGEYVYMCKIRPPLTYLFPLPEACLPVALHYLLPLTEAYVRRRFRHRPHRSRRGQPPGPAVPLLRCSAALALAPALRLRHQSEREAQL